MPGDSVLSILQRLIDPDDGTLSRAGAEAILELGFPESDQHRMIELAAKCNVGSLTPVEAEEYDEYLAAADLISLWKSKARIWMAKHQSAA